jgi:alanyl-tRNA synthetase
MPLAEAKKIPGVRAVFGEKYPDPVRVLVIGTDNPAAATVDDSVEFCGGTHLERTGGAGFFKIVSQEAVGKGIRRLTAVTGSAAVAAVQRMGTVLSGLTSRLNCKPDELSQRVESLLADVKKLQQQLEKGAASDLVGVVDRLLETAPEVHGARVIVGELPAASGDQIRQQLDRMRQKAPSAVIVVGWTEAEKVQFLCAVTENLVAQGLHAGKLVGQVAKIAGGSGGGKPTMAQAGGKEPQKLAEALTTARNLAQGMLSGTA